MLRAAVIIPFFQNEAGVLPRALMSVFEQTIDAKVDVFVVDDDSPVPAEREVRALEPPPNFELHLLKQLNTGPGGARNAALEVLDPTTGLVAFLDSDDEWVPEHLARAHRAISAGAALYFANAVTIDGESSLFAQYGFTPAAHPALGSDEHLREFDGDLFADLLAHRAPVSTPTVVLRADAFPRLRFREAFRFGGEDHFFWLEAVRARPRVAFSDVCEARLGRGVNIFASATWGTPTRLRRRYHEMLFRKAILTGFQLTEREHQSVIEEIGVIRKDAAQHALHAVRHGRLDPLVYWWKFIREDPVALLSLPTALIELAGVGSPPKT